MFQLLMGHAAFVLAVLSKFTVQGRPAEFKPGSVVHELQAVVRCATQYGNPSPVQPAHIKPFHLCQLREAVTLNARAVGLDRTYTSNTRQDAAEFFCDLLSAINRDAVASQVDGSVGWGHKQVHASAAAANEFAPRDPVTDLFAFVTETTVECHKCGESSTQYETTLNLTAYAPPGTVAPSVAWTLLISWLATTSTCASTVGASKTPPSTCDVCSATTCPGRR